MNNLPMKFVWRGISGSPIAARTAFVDRETAPTVIALPAPAPAVKTAKTVKAAPESLSFAVAAERPVRGDLKRFKYTTAQAAETAARRFVVGRGGSISIWLHDDKRYPVEIATVLRDSLDRVWTQVNAMPNERSYL